MAGGFPLSSAGKAASGNWMQGAATGASIGSIIPGIGTGVGAAIGAGLSLAPSLFRLIAGKKQNRDAKNMNIVDPGYQMNTGVLQNLDILQNSYGNYQMPGYNRAAGKIGSAYGTAFNSGINGASSSGDVLDLATKLAYGQSQAIGDLEAQNAIGKEQARGQFLNANAMAGQELVNKNAYDRDNYQRQLLERAGKIEASNQNIYGALDQGASVAGAYLNPKKSVTDPYSSTPANMAALLKFAKEHNIQI